MKPGARFEHPRATIDYAYHLVREYIEHEEEQDRLWKNKNPELVTKTDRKRSKPGGM
jgi:hypothetical protein